ncbi:lipase family protein [Bosea sp. 117]|uniref:lipase family protein n=1 Tax=Bosea sp. 117 TaxID=1125973 RepID=UPI0018CC241D|nr:lipase family protein [Bosea sp. 117]
MAFSSLVLAGTAAAQSSKSSGTRGAKSPAVRVYLMRGLANVFSYGMDDLAAKLNAAGVPATVGPYTEWPTMANLAAEQSAANGRTRTPVIVIGHSLGAGTAIDMANNLVARGVPVPLVVTFDPVAPATASTKIGRVVNYYQAGGSGKPVAGRNVNNVDLTGVPNLGHFNIDKAANLHAQVLAMIVRSKPPVARRAKPKPVAAPTEVVMPAGAGGQSTAPTASAGSSSPVPSAATPASASAPTAEARPAAPM